MRKTNIIEKAIFIILCVLTFSIWFSDGYLQHVNSDVTSSVTPGPMRASTIALPEAFWINDFQRTRWVPGIIDYIVYHTAGGVYREITGDPVNAIYFSQGLIAGILYLLLIMISAVYISFFAPLFSYRYLFSLGFLLAVTMSLPPWQPVVLFPVARFFHQTVMTHYLGTRIIALIVLLPYWRYLHLGKWDDWYQDIRLRAPWYVLVILSVFATLMTTISMVLIAGLGIVALAWTEFRNAKTSVGLKKRLENVFRDTKAHALVLVILLGAASIALESTSGQSSNGNALTIREYLPLFGEFVTGLYPLVLLGLIAVTALILLHYKRVDRDRESSGYREGALLLEMIPWILTGSAVFIFVIGFPAISYRFQGSNLGSDTILPATWLMLIWILAGWVSLWNQQKQAWLLPVAAIILSSHALQFFQDYKLFDLKQEQKKILSTLHELDKAMPLDEPLLIHNNKGVIGFDTKATRYTISFMRELSIISRQRKVELVEKETYENWLKNSKNGTSALPAAPTPVPKAAVLKVFKQEISSAAPVRTLKPKEATTMQIRVKNIGNEVWPSKGVEGTGVNRVGLGFRWINGAGKIIREGRTLLSYDLLSGSAALLEVSIQAPSLPGDYTVRFSMVQEQVAWFSDKGAGPYDISVSVK